MHRDATEGVPSEALVGPLAATSPCGLDEVPYVHWSAKDAKQLIDDRTLRWDAAHAPRVRCKRPTRTRANGTVVAMHTVNYYNRRDKRSLRVNALRRAHWSVRLDAHVQRRYPHVARFLPFKLHDHITLPAVYQYLHVHVARRAMRVARLIDGGLLTNTDETHRQIRAFAMTYEPFRFIRLTTCASDVCAHSYSVIAFIERFVELFDHRYDALMALVLKARLVKISVHTAIRSAYVMLSRMTLPARKLLFATLVSPAGTTGLVLLAQFISRMYFNMTMDGFWFDAAQKVIVQMGPSALLSILSIAPCVQKLLMVEAINGFAHAATEQVDSTRTGLRTAQAFTGMGMLTSAAGVMATIAGPVGLPAVATAAGALYTVGNVMKHLAPQVESAASARKMVRQTAMDVAKQGLEAPLTAGVVDSLQANVIDKMSDNAYAATEGLVRTAWVGGGAELLIASFKDRFLDNMIEQSTPDPMWHGGWFGQTYTMKPEPSEVSKTLGEFRERGSFAKTKAYDFVRSLETSIKAQGAKQRADLKQVLAETGKITTSAEFVKLCTDHPTTMAPLSIALFVLIATYTFMSAPVEEASRDGKHLRAVYDKGALDVLGADDYERLSAMVNAHDQARGSKAAMAFLHADSETKTASTPKARLDLMASITTVFRAGEKSARERNRTDQLAVDAAKRFQDTNTPAIFRTKQRADAPRPTMDSPELERLAVRLAVVQQRVKQSEPNTRVVVYDPTSR